MAKTRSFDPRTIVNEDLTLTRTADALNASAYKHQAVLHRQRVGAAKVQLARAMRRGASPDEIAALQDRVALRETRLSQAEAQFAAADIVGPAPTPDQAQVLGQVRGQAGMPPYTAALLNANGGVLASATVKETGGFVLAVGGAISGGRLQVSDAAQTVLFRDASGFDVAAGAVATRTVSLTDPGKPPAPPPTQLRMPDVVGQTEEAACAILFRIGVRDIDVARRVDAGSPGLVLSQTPEAGTELTPGAGAKLIVSERGETPGPEPVIMPDLVGLSADAARETAGDLGIKLAVTTQPGPPPKGRVTDQSPAAGTELARPLQASIVVSEGEADGGTVEVPDVVGQPEDKARAILRETGLTIARRTVPADGAPGLVVAQDPQGGTRVAASATVTLTVGTDGDRGEVDVPDLVGRPADAAREIAERAGFSVARRDVRGKGRAGLVVEQAPKPGTAMRLPATIEILVSVGGDAPRPDDGAFAGNLATVMAQDRRLAEIGLDRQAAASMAERLDLTSPGRVEAVVQLDNGALMEMTGLRNRSEARSLRSILRTASRRME